MLGGLYQSVLRTKLSHRYGITWQPIVNGQAEIDGVDPELLARFSKRSVQVDAALQDKLVEFAQREGRDPTRGERAALEREAAADTRGRKSGRPVVDLQDRWGMEARELGWTPERLTASLTGPGRGQRARPAVSVEQVLDELSAIGSAWTQADILRAVCDVTPAPTDMSGQRWAAALDRAVDRVLEHCVDLDPASDGHCRTPDGRSVWLEPIARQWTSPAFVAEEDRILTWALDAQVNPPRPYDTVRAGDLDVLQRDAAAAVAGRDRMVVVVGPPAQARRRCSPPPWTTSPDATERCSASRRRPRLPTSWPTERGCRPTRLRSCSTSGARAVVRLVRATACRQGRRSSSTGPAWLAPARWAGSSS
jgi:hypothetical protein